MKNKSLLIIVVVALIVGVAAFYGGMQYQQRQRTNFTALRTGQNGQFQGRGNFQGARPVNGEVINQDNKSIIVKLQDGSSKIVLLTDKTSVIEATASSVQNLKMGEKVLVSGSENSDGSVTAQSIQLNPQRMGNGMFSVNQ